MTTTSSRTAVGIRCAFCDTYFEWEAHHPKDPRPSYCTAYCRTRAAMEAQKIRDLYPPGVCPWPGKARFPDADAARKVIVANPVGRTRNRAYLCPEGTHHHIGRLNPPTPPVAPDLPPPPAPRLPPGVVPAPPPRRP